MKAVLLAGGLGTRLAEETGSRPKPMVEIGGRPIVWHIMKIYSSHHINERRGDDRGFFARVFCQNEFSQAGLVSKFV